MIGDHQQLRPSYTNYDLTVRHRRHHIDISMFERLCRAGVPYKRLALQHRLVSLWNGCFDLVMSLVLHVVVVVVPVAAGGLLGVLLED